MNTVDLDLARETFVAAILKALDTAATDVFGEDAHTVLGWADEDLPTILPLITRQIERVAEREAVYLHDWRTGVVVAGGVVSFL
jgi:hypothetical protein